MPITLTVTDEQLQENFNKALAALLTPGVYENPVKRTLDNMLGYNGDKEIKLQLETKIKEYVLNTMGTPEFATALGVAMAAEIAKREVEKLKR